MVTPSFRTLVRPFAGIAGNDRTVGSIRACSGGWAYSHLLGQYLVSLCVRRDFGGVAGVGVGGLHGSSIEAESAAVDGDGGVGDSAVCGCDSACCFLFFAHRSLLQEFRNPQFAIRDSYTCLLALSPLR